MVLAGVSSGHLPAISMFEYGRRGSFSTGLLANALTLPIGTHVRSQCVAQMLKISFFRQTAIILVFYIAFYMAAQENEHIRHRR